MIRRYVGKTDHTHRTLKSDHANVMRIICVSLSNLTLNRLAVWAKNGKNRQNRQMACNRATVKISAYSDFVISNNCVHYPVLIVLC